MTTSLLRLAVVGHTNTGKTSLVRTLTRNIGFGEVSDRPATTRHVEAAVLLADGRAVAELVDTPGMEDPIGLYDHLTNGLDVHRTDWHDLLRGFVEGDHDGGRFEQEAKALRQVLACDAALYVVDARIRVLGKYRDELDILGRCAKPIIPVLNFVADGQSRAPEWREQLARLGLHAVAEFDTVVLDAGSEQRLFETMRVLLDGFRPTLDALIADRARIRADLTAAAADRLADMLLDAAAYTVRVPAGADREAALAEVRSVVTERERRCVAELLDLFGFRPGDLDADAPCRCATAGGVWIRSIPRHWPSSASRSAAARRWERPPDWWSTSRSAARRSVWPRPSVPEPAPCGAASRTRGGGSPMPCAVFPSFGWEPRAFAYWRCVRRTSSKRCCAGAMRRRTGCAWRTPPMTGFQATCRRHWSAPGHIPNGLV